jgi:phosphatidylinositol alpha-mannosyltransferase
MKITVVSYYLPPTDRVGAGVQMHMLANAYVDLGHDVTLLAPNFEKDPTAKYSLASVQIDAPNRILKWSRFLSNYRFVADIVHFGGDDHLLRQSSDYIHLRTFMGSCFAEAKVAKGFKDKVRMTYLGLSEVLSSVKFHVLTVISADTNRYLACKGLVIPCGVDVSQFIPGPSKHHHPALLFVGTLDSRKRGRDLLNAFVNDIQPRFSNAELWLVRESGVVDIPGVKVYGSVSQEKLVELYQKAWVFCLPSSYEGFGVPYIEAMACGTPVVATPNPGALEVLDNGKYGVLTELDTLGASINSLLSNPEERVKYIELGLLRSKEYDILKVAQQYIDLAMAHRERKLSK